MSGDFDFEPIRGLPAVPPDGEQIVWQGAPSWRAYAVEVFHVRKLAIYFAVLIAWYVVTSMYDGKAWADIGSGLSFFFAGTAICLGLAAALAWGYAKSTVFTITTKRVVLRHGIALPMSINVPFSKIAAVQMEAHKPATGTIALTPISGNRIAWLALWPNVRPWQFSNPMPALRCVPDPHKVAKLLTNAMQHAEGDAVELAPVVRLVREPDAQSVDQPASAKAA